MSAFGTSFGTPLAASAAASGSSPLRAVGDSVGKSGRGLFSPSSKGTMVCVVCADDIGTPGLCGGSIGVSGMIMCMATAKECKVAKHLESKASLKPTIASETNTFVCIYQRNGKSIHTNLVVPVQLFNSVRLELYLKQSRQFDQWEMLFRGVLAPGGDADSEAAIEAFEDSITKRGLVEAEGTATSSPLKRLKPAEAVEDEELYLSPSDAYDADQFVSETHSKLKAIGDRMDGIEAKFNHHDLPAMDHHLSNLQRLIGQRPTDQPPIEVLTHLEMVASSIKELTDKPRSSLSEAEQTQLQNVFLTYGTDLQGLKDSMSESVVKYLAPMDAYFRSCTSAPAQGQLPVLGNILENRISSMENSVLSLENAAQGRHATAAFGAAGFATPLRNGGGLTGAGYGLGGFGQTTSFGTPAGAQPSNPVDLQNAITGLTTRIVELENSVSEEPGPPIMVDGIQIKNGSHFKSWLNSHVGTIDSDLVSCFPDVLGLLAMAGRSIKDDVNSLDLESKSVKAGYGGVNHFLISKSFMTALPSLFGTDKEGSAADSRILPRYKTFESFDPQVDYTGGLVDMKDKVLQEVRRSNTHIEDVLAGSARIVAKACVSRSDAFIRELFTWMSSTFHMLSNSSGNTSKAEAWNYVSHAIRAIFGHLQKARSPGYGTKDPSNMIWGCLKGKAAADEMLTTSFRKHPVVATVLNAHLQQSAVMRDEFDSVAKGFKSDIARLTSLVESAKSIADKALQKAGKG
jgi:hypothetical protein